MSDELSYSRIIGMGLLLFSSIILGVGIHHLMKTGTCSSTGYSANFGPVPHCPSGTGAWFAFVFGGIIGALAGGMMGGGLSSIFFGIFGAIGIGALTLGFSHGLASSTETFGIVFGAPFTIVGLVAGGYTVVAAAQLFRRPARSSGAAGRNPGGTRMSKTRHPSGGSRVATNAIAPPPAPFRPPVTPTTFMPPASTATQTASLAQLAELHRQGALTDDEFAAAKARVIGGVSA